ncbi:MAG: FmdB family zinc ribbon protein [Candidatus Binataceae bacterium]
MPIYEYKCPKCGVVEVMQRITEPALKKCPTCKSKVERQISLNSFVLKGTGWYASDYGKKTPAPATTESGSSSSDGAANGSASSSESKPTESKAESKAESKPKKESKPSTDKASAAKSAD